MPLCSEFQHKKSLWYKNNSYELRSSISGRGYLYGSSIIGASHQHDTQCKIIHVQYPNETLANAQSKSIGVVCVKIARVQEYRNSVYITMRLAWSAYIVGAHLPTIVYEYIHHTYLRYWEQTRRNCPHPVWKQLLNQPFDWNTHMYNSAIIKCNNTQGTAYAIITICITKNIHWSIRGGRSLVTQDNLYVFEAIKQWPGICYDYFEIIYTSHVFIMISSMLNHIRKGSSDLSCSTRSHMGIIPLSLHTAMSCGFSEALQDSE